MRIRSPFGQPQPASAQVNWNLSRNCCMMPRRECFRLSRFFKQPKRHTAFTPCVPFCQYIRYSYSFYALNVFLPLPAEFLPGYSLAVILIIVLLLVPKGLSLLPLRGTISQVRSYRYAGQNLPGLYCGLGGLEPLLRLPWLSSIVESACLYMCIFLPPDSTVIILASNPVKTPSN